MCLMYDTSSPVYSSAPDICCRAALSAACACLRAEGCETLWDHSLLFEPGTSLDKNCQREGTTTRAAEAPATTHALCHTHTPHRTHTTDRARPARRAGSTPPQRRLFSSVLLLCSSTRPLHCPVAACEQVQATQEQQSISSKLKKKNVMRRAAQVVLSAAGRTRGTAAAMAGLQASPRRCFAAAAPPPQVRRLASKAVLPTFSTSNAPRRTQCTRRWRFTEAVALAHGDGHVAKRFGALSPTHACGGTTRSTCLPHLH